jgi:hypothetical protein
VDVVRFILGDGRLTADSHAHLKPGTEGGWVFEELDAPLLELFGSMAGRVSIDTARRSEPQSRRECLLITSPSERS